MSYLCLYLSIYLSIFLSPLQLPPFSTLLLFTLSLAHGTTRHDTHGRSAQCMLMGVGEGLSIIPAVDLMRMALPGELVVGGDDEDVVTASLAAIMSAATSLGEVRALCFACPCACAEPGA